jgi:acyl-CoA reductase-like NAD-dependent aldehyde dehydrogenase
MTEAIMLSEPGMLIGGEKVAAIARFGVTNPATGAVFAEAPDCSLEQLDRAMRSAAGAFAMWRRDDDERRAVLREGAAALERRIEPLSSVLTSEQGKPLMDARIEVMTAVAWLRYYAELELPRQIVQDDATGFIEITRKPLGVVVGITPWNFPLALAMWKIAPALRAGNTMVVKPSPYTPLATLAMGEILQDVLPPGVLNVITGRDPLGASMVAHPTPRKISFTGSTAAGKDVAVSAAQDLKRVTLELGGNDPAIILDDADPDQIADLLFAAAFMNNGQTCLAAKRIYAPDRIYADVVEALAQRADSAVVGDGTTDGVRFGPINNKPQLDRVTELVSDALANGARAAAGGRPIDRPGYFFEPTVLSDIDDGVRIVDEEQFGPAVPVIAYRTVEDAIARANNSEFGLTASVWSPDLDRATAVAAQIDAGQVSINIHGGGVQMHVPFGGHKSSGVGVENGPWGLYGFTEMQVLARPAFPAAPGIGDPARSTML